MSGNGAAIRYFFNPLIHLTIDTFNKLAEDFQEETMIFFCQAMQAQPDQLKEEWQKLLLLSVRHNSLSLLDLVMQQKRYVDLIHIDKTEGMTPLMMAAQQGSAKMVEALLKHYIAVNSTQLDAASQAANLLLEEDKNGATVFTYLLNAVHQQSTTFVKPMLQSLKEIINTDELFFCALHSSLIAAIEITFNPAKHLTKEFFEIVLKQSNSDIIRFFCIEFDRPPSPLATELSPDDWHELMDLSLSLNHLDAFRLASRKISYPALNYKVDNKGKNLLMRTVCVSDEFTQAILKTNPDISIVNQLDGKTAFDYAYENLFASLVAVITHSHNLEITYDVLNTPPLSKRWLTLSALVKHKESTLATAAAHYQPETIRFLTYLAKHTNIKLMSECITKYVIMSNQKSKRILVMLAWCLPYMSAELGTWFATTYFERVNAALNPSYSGDYPGLLFREAGQTDLWRLLFALYSKPEMAHRLFNSAAGVSILFRALTIPENLITILDIYKPNVNICSENGNTLLIEAIRGKQLTVIKRLLKHGADTTQPGADGDSALLLAMRMNEIEICQELLSSSKNKLELLTFKNSYGESALSYVFGENSTQRLNLLNRISLDEEALNYINPTTNLSLLMDAARCENITNLIWLIKAGANIHLQNSLNQSVSDFAKDYDVRFIINFILTYDLQKKLDLQHWSQLNTRQSREILAFLARPEFKGICGDINLALKKFHPMRSR